MNKYLIDTCVLSEYVKKAPNIQVINWLDTLNEGDLYISILTLGELKKGAIKQQSININRYNKLIAWIKIVENRFRDRILLIDKTVINIWASLSGKSESKGVSLPIVDSLIAATAQSHRLKIVTRNINDFTFYSKLINPWNL